MKLAFLSIGSSIVLAALSFADGPAPTDNVPSGGAPFAIPTFHCLGLYWSPPGGAADKRVLVRYRRQGASQWKEALPMRYNPIPNTDEDLTDYRGSIVHLTPATTYEIQLTLAGSSTTTSLTATTWSEDFPVGETIRVRDRNTPLAITESGTSEAYRVYDGRGATIDVRHRHDNCITIDASYVIVRGLTLQGAGASDNASSKPIGAIVITGGHDVIIEGCDISDWGRLNPRTGFGFNYESAILSHCASLQRLVIQRCKLHDPSFDGSNWYEPTHPTHSRGPQCISLFNAGGNHVIRYNECWSDMEHMFNDITQCMMMIGNAADSIGPLYIWRNVCARSQWQPNASGGYFLKMGFAGGQQWMTGHMYIFHNTIFRSDEWLPTGALGGSPGVNAGQAIPNFSDGYTGQAPDIGAHQRGALPIRYGVEGSQW